jgi:uncharacterized protein (DUF1499 family)
MRAAVALLVLAAIAAGAVAASGFGARFGVWDWRVGFEVLRFGVYASFGLAALALIALLVPRSRRGNATVLVLALAIAVVAGGLPAWWFKHGASLPPINDIATDTDNPPPFVAIVPLRGDAKVSIAYPGETYARQQHAAYPDIRPLELAASPPTAFARALEAARAMHWDVVATDPVAGRIEATATTPWFGFKDDVVIRVAAAPGGSRVDVRSVSRVGQGDLGANAARIRAYLDRLRKGA